MARNSNNTTLIDEVVILARCPERYKRLFEPIYYRSRNLNGALTISGNVLALGACRSIISKLLDLLNELNKLEVDVFDICWIDSFNIKVSCSFTEHLVVNSSYGNRIMVVTSGGPTIIDLDDKLTNIDKAIEFINDCILPENKK